MIATRSALIKALEDRLDPTLYDEKGSPVDCMESGKNVVVTGFRDPDFVAAFEPGLQRLPNAELVNQALALLIRRVNAAPPGKTGMPCFDTFGVGDADGGPEV